MDIVKKHWQLTLFVIAVLSISGYLFYQSQQPPEQNVTRVVLQTPDTPTEKAPVGDTSQGGHWHGDEWHAEPHEAVETPHETENPAVPVETDASLQVPGTEAHRAPSSQSPADGSRVPSAVELDPETQARVDALYKQADALSKEASVWSNRLYAESQEHLKEVDENKAEIAKAREMLSDPNVDKATYKAFQDALDVRVRAQNAEAIRLNDLYIQNWDRRDEVMRLRTEARRLQGLE